MAEKIVLEFTKEEIGACTTWSSFGSSLADDPELLPELELDEIDTLVGALVALERALGGNL